MIKNITFILILIIIFFLIIYSKFITFPSNETFINKNSNNYWSQTNNLMDKQYDQQMVINGKKDEFIKQKKIESQENTEKMQLFLNDVLKNINKISFPDENIENRSTLQLTCPSAFQKEYTFCHLDSNELLNLPNYQCVFKKSNQIFPVNPACCNFECTRDNLKKEILKNKKDWNPNPNPSYYCLEPDNKCHRYTTDLFHPDRNTCGQNMLSQYPLKTYSTKKDCEKAIICEKIKNKQSCLKTALCGWCTDENGNGKCVDGTPEGPMRLDKYYYCLPDKKTQENAYKYAFPSSYELQEDTNPGFS